jgi:hypothetical protein
MTVPIQFRFCLFLLTGIKQIQVGQYDVRHMEYPRPIDWINVTGYAVLALTALVLALVVVL